MADSFMFGLVSESAFPPSDGPATDHMTELFVVLQSCSHGDSLRVTHFQPTSKGLSMGNVAKLQEWFSQLLSHGPAYAISVITGVLVIVYVAFDIKRLWALVVGLYRHLSGKCDKVEAEFHKQLAVELKNSQGRIDQLRDRHAEIEAELTQKLESVTENAATNEKSLEALRSQILTIRDRYNDISTGGIWATTPIKAVPKFKPYALMQKPIISVFNLKGGVGKTTLSANLAAAYWGQGLRVLLIDMDYQASLTLHCLTAEQINNLNKLKSVTHVIQAVEVTQEEATESWLQKSVNGDANRDEFLQEIVTQRMQPIGSTGSFILPTNSSFDAYEIKTMIKWIFRQSKDDVRFRLRSILHSDWLAQSFDRVIIDCPPRLTLASVNALAASHFVLVPAVPDILSTDTVGELFATLRKLRPHVCPDLSVLGVVANKGRKEYGKDELLAKHKNRITELGVQNELRNDGFTLGANTILKTWIPSKVAAELDGGEAFNELDDDLKAPFYDLATEIDKRIRNYAGKATAKVHS